MRTLLIKRRRAGTLIVFKHSPWKLAVLSSFLGMAGLSPALAQQAEASGSSSADTNEGEIQTLVVRGSYTVSDKIDMATGLGLTPQETPQSVSVITQQQLRDQNLTSVVDVIANAVGVSTNEIDDVRNTFYARGFEITNYQIDGVPLAWTLAGDAGETMADTSIYERIEIVRGATGLLTGAGDPSASINLVRKHADSREFTGYVQGLYGSWNGVGTVADVSSALSPGGAIRGRVVGKYEQGDSYMDLYEDKRTVFYGVIDADITDSTLLRVGASQQDSDPTSPTWGALPSLYSDGSHTDWARYTTTAADWTKWHTTNTNYFANLVQSFSNGWQLIGNFNHLKNEQKTRLLYISGTPDEASGGGLNAFPYRASGFSEQNSIDAQLKGHFKLFQRRHEFVVGALHSEQTAQTTSYSALEFPPADSIYNRDGSYPQPPWAAEGTLQESLKTTQDGLYTAGRFSVTKSMRVIAGGRLASWKREGSSYGAAQNFGDDNVFIPYAGALYDLNATHRLYASYTQIYKPQNLRTQDGSYIDPLTGKSGEIGLKSRFLNDALQTTVTLFRTEQDNLGQADGIVQDTSSNPIPETAYRAAQGTKSKGFEFEVVGKPTQNLNLSMGFTRFQAEDAEGVKVNTDAARQMFKLFATYTVPTVQGLTLGGGANWQNEIYSDYINPITKAYDPLRQGAYTLISLMARYEINEQLSVQFNANNVADTKYYSQVGFYDQYRYGDPANFALNLRYSFGQ